MIQIEYFGALTGSAGRVLRVEGVELKKGDHPYPIAFNVRTVCEFCFRSHVLGLCQESKKKINLSFRS